MLAKSAHGTITACLYLHQPSRWLTPNNAAGRRLADISTPSFTPFMMMKGRR